MMKALRVTWRRRQAGSLCLEIANASPKSVDRQERRYRPEGLMTTPEMFSAAVFLMALVLACTFAALWFNDDGRLT